MNTFFVIRGGVILQKILLLGDMGVVVDPNDVLISCSAEDKIEDFALVGGKLVKQAGDRYTRMQKRKELLGIKTNGRDVSERFRAPDKEHQDPTNKG